MAKNILTTEEIKNKLLLSINKQGNNVLHWAASHVKPDVLQKILYMAKDILATEEFEKLIVTNHTNLRK
jgi:hypothetical protein